MQSSEKVLPKIIIPLWGFTKAGGSRVLSKFVNNWTENNVDVLVICYFKSIKPYFPINGKIVYVDGSGNEVDRVDPIASSSKIDLIKEMKLKHSGLLKAINRYANEYDSIIANYAMSAFGVNKSLVRNKFYYIQAYEAWDNRRGIGGKIINEIIKKTYKLPLIRIVNAEIYTDYKEIKSRYVVPPGLDLNLYYPRNEYWDGYRPFIVGCIGRTEAWKGSEDVAIAVEMLQNKHINVQFDVAFNPVKHSRFNLVKPDGDDKLSEYYRNIDVLVAPGTLQLGAIHYPVIEAMAVGTPVITTGYYPASEKNAYIVPVSAPEKIAETIESIINNYEEAINRAQVALHDIQAFSWDNVCEKMLDIIKENQK